MIKLIASDMDGTLLTDEKEFNEEIYSLIGDMKQMGITFVAASGRQFPSLYHLFAPVKEDIYFIAENGAFVYHQGKELYSSVMERPLWEKIVDHAWRLPGVEPLLCGKYSAYTTRQETFEMMASDRFHYQMTLVEDLMDVQEEILKVSFLDLLDVQKNSYQNLLPIFGEYTEMAVSGYNCMDIVNKGVNKGVAIQKIQEAAGAGYDDTVAFGDNFNDIEMLAAAKISYAMENAHEDVKKCARFIAGDNNKHAVIAELKRLLSGILPVHDKTEEYKTQGLGGQK